MKNLIPFLRSVPPLPAERDDLIDLKPHEVAPRSRVEFARESINHSRNRLLSVEANLEAEIARLTKDLEETRVVLAASDAFAATLDQAEQIAAE